MKHIATKKSIFALAAAMVLLVMSCAGPSSTDPTSQDTTPTTSQTTNTTSVSEEPSTSGPTTSPTTPPTSEETFVALNDPILVLNEKNGLVSWESVPDAEFYSYYTNGSNIYTTQSTSIKIDNGSTLSVRAESSLKNTISSNWSKPVTYFETITVTEYVTIYFHGSNFEPVTIVKGEKYSPKNPTKDYHTFNGWYLDPYYKNELTSDYIFNENTILFAHFSPNEAVNNVTYWIKANPLVSGTTSVPSTSWKYIPLHEDAAKSKELGKKIYSGIVTVKGTTSTEYGEYIVTDGLTDNEGRTYFKNGESNFTLKTDGTYKINFSVEYFWDYKGNNVNCFAEQVSSTSNLLENEHTLPETLLSNSNELETPSLSFDETNELVKWANVSGATAYEYIIDNGEIQTTTSNNITLYKGSHITVRAISDLSGKLPSRWTAPFKCELTSYPYSIYVYFYGSNRPSEAIPYGSKISKPTTDPVKPGYKFGGWYENIGCTKAFDFNQVLYKNTVIYAKFTYLNETKFTLLSSNKSTLLANFVVSEQYGYNEWKATYTVSTDLTTYVKDLENNKYYGPYKMEAAGKYTMYFSTDHKWDLGESTERNAYWASDSITIYFSNNKNWGSVYYYTWNDAGYKTAWPGELCTYVETNDYGEKIYKVTLATSYDYIIFNDNNGTQTVNISLSGVTTGTGYYCTDKDGEGKYQVGTYNY